MSHILFLYDHVAWWLSPNQKVNTEMLITYTGATYALYTVTIKTNWQNILKHRILKLCLFETLLRETNGVQYRFMYI